jgi:hypothetical protein
VAVVVTLLLVAVMAGGVTLWRWYRQYQIEHFRQQARLRVIEGQLATLRATLRIQTAEHYTKRRLHIAAQDDDRQQGWHS